MDKEQILIDLGKAVSELKDALSIKAETNLIKAGCIQYFEFCFELSWKSIKIISAEQGMDCLSPKSCLKQAYQMGWITNEVLWLHMLQARNRLSHTYDSEFAITIYGDLRHYCKAIEALYLSLKAVDD